MGASKKTTNEEEIISPPEKTKTLVVIESPRKRVLFSQNLNIYTGTEVINKFNADDAIEFLKEHSEEIDLIVCKEKVGEENTVLKVFYYVKSQELGIPMVLIGHQSRLAGEVTMVAPDADWTEVIKAAAKCLHITPQRMILLSTEEYFPIDIKIFLSLKNTPTSIFKKERQDEEQYEKVFSSGSTVEADKVRELIQSGLDRLYVLSAERLKFTRGFSEQVLQELNNEDSKDKMIQMTGALFSYSQNLIQKTGMDEGAIKSAGQTINSMIKISQKAKAVSNLFKIVMENDESYVYNKAILTSMIGHKLIEKMDWASKEFKHKLCFMSFFVDITIPDEEMCKIRTNTELESSSLNEDQKKKVLNHAYEVVELLRGYPDCPFGAEDLILEHHGKKNGIGFCDEQLDSQISPMASLFMVVESFAVLLMAGEDKKSILDVLRSKFNIVPYKKIVASLEEMLLEEN